MALRIILTFLSIFGSLSRGYDSESTTNEYAAESEICGPLAQVWGGEALHVPYGAAKDYGVVALGCEDYDECVIFSCQKGRTLLGHQVVRCNIATREWDFRPQCVLTTTAKRTTPTMTPVFTISQASLTIKEEEDLDPCVDSPKLDEPFCWRPKLRWRYNEYTKVCEAFETCARGRDLGGNQTNVFATQFECRLICHAGTRRPTTPKKVVQTLIQYPIIAFTTKPPTITPTTITTTMMTTTTTTGAKTTAVAKTTKPGIIVTITDRRVKTGGLRGPQCLKGVDMRRHSSCLGDSPNLIATLPVDAREILSLHNAMRRNVTPPSRFMPDLAWNFDLALTAERFAATCPSEIGDLPEDRALPGWSSVGQNACHSISSELSFKECIGQLWGGEQQLWQYGTGETMAEAVVSHYTQIIWAGTLFVGCGAARCQNSMWTSTIVCNYAPSGNVAPSGQNPLAYPYISKDDM